MNVDDIAQGPFATASAEAMIGTGSPTWDATEDTNQIATLVTQLQTGTIPWPNTSTADAPTFTFPTPSQEIAFSTSSPTWEQDPYITVTPDPNMGEESWQVRVITIWGVNVRECPRTTCPIAFKAPFNDTLNLWRDTCTKPESNNPNGYTWCSLNVGGSQRLFIAISSNTTTFVTFEYPE